MRGLCPGVPEFVVRDAPRDHAMNLGSVIRGIAFAGVFHDHHLHIFILSRGLPAHRRCNFWRRGRLCFDGDGVFNASASGSVGR